MSARLSETVDEYLHSRAVQGFAANTIRNDKRALLKLLTVVGNIYINNLTHGHVDRVFSVAAETLGDAALNGFHDSLSAFFKWARMRGRMRKDHDPLEGRRKRKVMARARRRVPLAQFPQLLDACEHPRDRMVVALGLYLFLRQGEIVTLRLEDVDLDSGEIQVTVWKSTTKDVMPISEELDGELRRWLKTYPAPAEAHWYLAPAKRAFQPVKDERGRFVRHVAADRLQPTRQMVKVEEVAQRALEAIGFPTRLDDGTSSWEGIHTLRRSGARALFDELADRGYDGALRRVQAMLHHANSSTTEAYLGIDLDRKQRDDAIKGKPLFPSLSAPGVTMLHPRGEGNSVGMR